MVTRKTQTCGTRRACRLLDGRALADSLGTVLREHALTFQRHTRRRVGLRVVMWGDDPASKIYVQNKQRKAEELGLHFTGYAFAQDDPFEDVLKVIEGLNQDAFCHGLIVQLPIPETARTAELLDAVSPTKDVDGLHPYSRGRLYASDTDPTFVPCTPWGCLQLLKAHDIALKGKHVVVVGRSSLVGRSFAALCLKEDATVTIVHSASENVKQLTLQADILCVAAGKPGLIDASYVKEGAAVLDVGIHPLSDGMCGDVVFEDVATKAAWLSPVPRGVGPMTVMGLMHNTLQAAYRAYGLPAFQL